MPPTPFQPSHRSPFKSTLSTSQQVRKRSENAPSPTYPETSQEGLKGLSNISPASLRPNDWTFLAEGAKNLVLRYKGPCQSPFVHSRGAGHSAEERVALRIPKRSRGNSSPTAAPSTSVTSVGRENEREKQTKVQIGAAQWRAYVVEPLLAPVEIPSLLPPLLPLDIRGEEERALLKTFLETIVTKIELMRPIERRRASGIDTSDNAISYICATQDLSVGDVYAFEIKPKCGFKPSGKNLSEQTRSAKTQNSRYKMHQILKSLKAERFGKEETADLFSNADWDCLYDPLDLFSEEEPRIERAIEALWSEWKSLNFSSPSLSMQEKQRSNLCVFLDGVPLQAAQVSASVQHDALFTAFRQALLSEKVKRVLQHLVRLQQVFDPHDIEGIFKRWNDEVGTRFGEAPEPESAAYGIMDSVRLEEFVDAVQRGIRRLSSPIAERSLESSLPSTTLRQDLVDLLLSAMWKDCSLFLRTEPQSGQVQVHLVDLDPKDLSKLGYWKQLDEDVVAAYHSWRRSHSE